MATSLWVVPGVTCAGSTDALSPFIFCVTELVQKVRQGWGVGGRQRCSRVGRNEILKNDLPDAETEIHWWSILSSRGEE